MMDAAQLENQSIKDEQKAGTVNKSDVLKMRARALATQPSSVVQEECIEVAEFLLGAESYAFELDYLREVCPLADVTFIPCAPPFVVGVINLRGLIIPIIDILAFLEIDHERINVFNKAVILQTESMVIGLLADEVVGASKLPVSALQTLTSLTGLAAEYFKGVTQDRLVVLDAKKIMTDSRLNPSDEDEE